MSSDTDSGLDDFRPTSHNAMFATILARLKAQDKSAEEWRALNKSLLDEIKIEVKKTNGRVTALEQWRKVFKGKVALLVIIGSGTVTLIGWAIGLYFSVK